MSVDLISNFISCATQHTLKYCVPNRFYFTFRRHRDKNMGVKSSRENYGEELDLAQWIEIDNNDELNSKL